MATNLKIIKNLCRPTASQMIIGLGICYYLLAFAIDPLSDLQFFPFGVGYWWGDSATYVNYSFFRPLAYPFLLSVTYHVFGAHEKIFILQHLVHIGACYYLWQIGKIYIQRHLWLMVWLVIFLNPVSFIYHYAILTDSLFYSLVIIIAAQLIDAYHRKPNHYYPLAVTIGLAILLRPVGVTLIPMLVILHLCMHDSLRQTYKKLIYGLAVILLIFTAERVAHKLYHIDTSTNPQNLSISDIILVGKAGVIATMIPADELLPATHSEYDLARNFAREAQVFSAISQNFSAYCFTKAGSFLEVYFQHGHFRQSKLEQRAVSNISADIVRQYPVEWAKITACNYLHGWLILPEYSVFFQSTYSQAIASLFTGLANNPFDDLARIYFYHISASYHWVTPLLMLFALMGVCCFGLMLAQFYHWFARKKASSAMGCAMFLSFLPQGYLLGVAIFNIASQRYSLAIAPVVLLVAGFLIQAVMPKAWQMIKMIYHALFCRYAT